MLEIAGGGSEKIVPGSGTNCSRRIPGNLCNPGGLLSVTNKQIKQTNKQTKYCVLNQVRQRQIAEAAAGQISAIHWSADNDTHGGEGDDNDCYGNKAPSTVKMTCQMQN